MTGKQLLLSKMFVFIALTPKAHEGKSAVLLSLGFTVGEDDKPVGEEKVQLTALECSFSGTHARATLSCSSLF